MARYIDMDGYRKLFDEEYKKTRKLISEGETHLDNLAEGFSEASRVIDRMPTADVAPKSEVAREIFEEIENIIKSSHTVGFTLTAPLKEALKEHNDGIRKEKLYYISKLKKKYTEGEG